MVRHSCARGHGELDNDLPIPHSHPPRSLHHSVAAFRWGSASRRQFEIRKAASTNLEQAKARDCNHDPVVYKARKIKYVRPYPTTPGTNPNGTAIPAAEGDVSTVSRPHEVGDFGADHGTISPISQSGRLCGMPGMPSPTCKQKIVSAFFQNVAIELKTAGMGSWVLVQSPCSVSAGQRPVVRGRDDSWCAEK